MKKYVLTTFLVVVLSCVLIVPAFADTATRIGTTSYYYCLDNGFGGGVHSGSYHEVPFSILNDYMDNALNATNVYWAFYISDVSGFARICVEHNGDFVGYLCDSSGNVYIADTSVDDGGGGTSSGGTSSGIDYTDILTSIKNLLLSINTKVTNIYNNMGTGGGTDIDINLPDIDTHIVDMDNNLTLQFGSLIDSIQTLGTNTDEIESKLSNIYSILNYGFSTVNDYLYDVSDYSYTTSTRLGSTNTILSAIRSRVVDGFDSVNGNLVSIENTLSNLGGSGNTTIVPTTSSPYVRKIYNALYGGVDGTGADMVDIAISQMGVSEGQPYYTWYGFDSHVEWCACFVSWCANECGYLDDIVPKFAVVDDGVAWYQSRSLWLNGGDSPSPGDIIFFDWDGDHDPDHVGIVADCVDGVVTTVEGNTGDSPGVVSSRSISADSSLIYGYGTPEYSSSGESIYSVLLDISHKIGRSSSYDDSVLMSRLDRLDANISNISTLTTGTNSDTYYGELLYDNSEGAYQIYLGDDVRHYVPGMPIFLHTDLTNYDIFTDESLYVFVFDNHGDILYEYFYDDFVDGTVKFYIPPDFDIGTDTLYVYAQVDYDDPGNLLDYFDVYSCPEVHSLTWFQWFYDWANNHDVSSYDDTVLINKLTDIENALSNLGDGVSTSIENVTNVDMCCVSKLARELVCPLHSASG